MESVGARFDADKLVRRANSLNAVRFKDRTGEIELFGEKAILLRRDALKIMRKEMEQNVGHGTAIMILRMAGKSIGAREGVLLMKSARSNGFFLGQVDTKFLSVTLEELNVGFGKIILLGLDSSQSTASLRVENCFEALENGPVSQETCQFTAGFLEGFFSEILENKLRAQERACLSKGASACEFSLAPSKLT